MPTGQQIVNAALTEIGMLEQGGVPSTSDSTDGLAKLNAMWAAMGIDEGLIYAEQINRFPLAALIAGYTIGVGAQFNMPRPGRIYRASVTSVVGGAIATSSLGVGGSGYAANDTGTILDASGTPATYLVTTVSAGVVTAFSISAAGTGNSPAYGVRTQTGGAQAGSGTGLTINILTVTTQGQNRNELKIVNADEYYAHNDLAAQAMTPEEIYPDFTVDGSGSTGLGHIYFFPVPNLLAVLNLELQTGVAFSTWTLTANYNLPEGFQDLLQEALAFRLLPSFGAAVAQEVALLVTANAQRAEARIREMNRINRKLPPQAVMAPSTQPVAAGAQPGA